MLPGEERVPSRHRLDALHNVSFRQSACHWRSPKIHIHTSMPARRGRRGCGLGPRRLSAWPPGARSVPACRRHTHTDTSPRFDVRVMA